MGRDGQRAGGEWVLPGSGGKIGSKSASDGNSWETALVRRFLEDTGLEKFPKLKSIRYYEDKSRPNRHPIRIYEAETDENFSIAEITPEKPTFGTRRMDESRSVLETDAKGNLCTDVNPAHVKGLQDILREHRAMLRNFEANPEPAKYVKDNALESFAGATLSGTTVNKVQSEPVVEEPPIEEPAVVEGPTQAELAAQQQAAALAQQQQVAANANANNATTGNAATTTEGEDKKDEKKKSLAWLWITLAVVGVLAIAVTAYCCMSGDSTPEQEELV